MKTYIPITVAFLLAFFSGCYHELANVSKDIKYDQESIVLGQVQDSYPKLGEFNLSGLGEIRGGHLFPKSLEEADNESQQGFFFKVVEPGTYELNLEVQLPAANSPTGYVYIYTRIMRFIVPKGSLISLGSIVSKGGDNYTCNQEDDNPLRLFQKRYPEIYQLYKNKLTKPELLYLR